MMAHQSNLHGIDRPALDRVVEPIARAHGAEVVDVEFKPERAGWVLRISVERAGACERLLSTKEAAVSLELCAGISRDLSPALDVADLITHPYHLEVSSPGVERPLRDERDYVRFKGAKAKLKLTVPLEAEGANGHQRPPAAVVTGVIDGVTEDGKVRLVDSGRTEEVPLSMVERGRLVFEFGTATHPAGSPGTRRAGGPRAHKRKH
jgi:ribosome maturation factor RimP